MVMVNKIILAVCSTVVLVASQKIISWLEHKLDTKESKDKKDK